MPLGRRSPYHCRTGYKRILSGYWFVRIKSGQRIFVGVIDVINPDVEEPEQVRDRILQAAEYIPVAQLGTTDDCGFSPFEDDTSTGRDTAFAKIKSRVMGTELASKILNC